jgi:3-methyl-2-oxobutanoate hydroxymethyltransferase
VPKFVKMYETMFERGVNAMRSYAEEVRSGAFPTAAHSFGSNANAAAKLTEPSAPTEPVH